MPLEMIGVHTEYRMPLPDEPGQNGDFTAVYPLIVRETDVRREILTIDGRLVASKERTGQCSPTQLRSAHEVTRPSNGFAHVSQTDFDALVRGIGDRELRWHNKGRRELLWGDMIVVPRS